MFTKLYSAKAILNSDEINVIMDALPNETKRECFLFVKGLDGEITIDVNGQDLTILIMNDIELDKFKALSEKTGIHYKVKDISKDAIYGRLPKDLVKVTEVDEIVTNFINNNATKDMILDKINEAGIESLTELDKRILAK